MKKYRTKEYTCSDCKTINNKWNKLYLETDGKMLIEVKGKVISLCGGCAKLKIRSVNEMDLKFIHTPLIEHLNSIYRH